MADSSDSSGASDRERALEAAAAEMVAAADATWGLDVWRKWEMENGPSGRWVKAILALEGLVRP